MPHQPADAGRSPGSTLTTAQGRTTTISRSDLMPPELTPALERALAAARGWARRLGADDVRPPHLLLGLLEEGEGRAASLLRAAGIDPIATRDALAGLAAGKQT